MASPVLRHLNNEVTKQQQVHLIKINCQQYVNESHDPKHQHNHQQLQQLNLQVIICSTNILLRTVVAYVANADHDKDDDEADDYVANDGDMQLAEDDDDDNDNDYDNNNKRRNIKLRNRMGKQMILKGEQEKEQKETGWDGR